MFPKDVELILARHLASCLATPMFIVDTDGNLIFYNEPAETILGRRFDESGEMSASELASLFTPTDRTGEPLALESLPLIIALSERRPASRSFWIRGLDGVRRRIGVTALPLFGQAERFLGAIAFFWEDHG